MTTQLHDQGEEFVAKVIWENDVYSPPTDVHVGLYHDDEVSGDSTNGDNLSDASTPSSITTEPSGYSKWTISLGLSSWTAQTDTSTNWYASNDNSHSFDLSGDTSSSEIDAWFIEADVDLNNDATAETILIVTGNLSQSYTLDSVDTLTVQSDGIGFTTN